MSCWDEWIGREESRSDRIDAGHAARWLATLDLPHPADGALPQGFHLCVCLPDTPTAGLGLDGHPARDGSAGSFFPPAPQPRRMWAGSRMEFHAPLRIGEALHRRSRVVSITEKSGGSGQLVFVDVEHETSGEAGLAVREVQSIVYRDAPPAGSPPAPPPLATTDFDPSGWQAHRALVPSEALLFRYSALTFNTHRIHYDYPYVTAIENYRGLVVHGPLIATLLLQLAQRELGTNALREFSFRGLSPAVAGEELHLVMGEQDGGYALAAFAADGRQITAASVRL